ncbi:hypothetical protein CPIN17260_0128 [Campylobacter pinnipediorum subsp. pinnipediorum]|uniref:hypothetical protein n=1 Tax=Campylobacter pinnipediorum TaxID=1965231 RepID=UPI0009959391|nr:hypothetical protein [Campylobacter pinnipediorum]AQW80484.1 hypothetical protein CPIN17260_0128 [Campylobacter pinnipediorum subsp. pinnipediorum]
MKLNDNGSITLKFDSGRMIAVKELYNYTGRLNTTIDKKATTNLEVKNMTEEELNKIDFANIGIREKAKNKEEYGFKSLREIGATAIKKAIGEDNEVNFLIHLAGDKLISTNELYNIMYIKHTIQNEKPMLRKKVDVRI